ncbi:MAG: 2-hydroxy-3-oxopropionate reductase [Actinomycetia bacterium]|nr:2-hydroxy-3-oxopropionate reductase [Actinomycetes bacterium]
MNLIGFIGTGIMGKHMAKNLIKAGYKVLVYDIEILPLKELEKEGAQICKSIEEMVQKAPTIITMLPNSPQSEEVILGDKGIIRFAAKDTMVIDMSSIDPMVSIKIGKKLASNGIKFLDAPVSGGEPKAIDGTLAIMVGGKESTFDKAVPIFKILGSSYTLVGDIGAGNFTKLSNQMIVAINIAAVSEALLLAKKAGLSPEKVFNAIRGGLAGSTVLDSKAPMMIDSNFKAGFKIKLHLKDLQNVINASSSLNIPLPLSAQLLEILKSLTASGMGELDHSGILKYFENISDVKLVK